MKHTILGVCCLLLMGLSWQVGAYDKDDLKKLLETKQCQKCELEGANLTDANLSEANLEGANHNYSCYSSLVTNMEYLYPENLKRNFYR